MNVEIRITDGATTVTPRKSERLIDRAGATLTDAGVTSTLTAVVKNLIAGNDTILVVQENYGGIKGGRAYGVASDDNTARWTEYLPDSNSRHSVTDQHHTGNTKQLAILLKAETGQYLLPFLGGNPVTFLVDEGLLYVSTI